MIKLKRNEIIFAFLGLIFFAVLGWVFFAYKISCSLLLAILFFCIYLKYFRKKLEPSYTHLSFLIVLSIASLLITRQSGLGIYSMPIIALAILSTVLFEDIEVSFVYNLFNSLMVCFIYKMDVRGFVVMLLSGLTASFFSLKVRRRTSIIKAGIIAGIVEFLLGYALISKTYGNGDIMGVLKESMLNGFISSVIVIGVLPLFEALFGVITNISLLELSDFNHPILRKMILEAPGTYQHSLVVANLAETAAEEIGANSLLARVGAYYHDIGKIGKSEYFSENQMLASQRDKHKKLNPSMSKLIIINHIKEGVELARKYRLNRKIIDFIQQHHGTTLVYYFYRMAQQKDSSSGKKESEDAYRYPGPKPNSKEIAIVHLADTVEARSRALEDPSPARIKEMVKDSINKRLLDGQLSESNLTMKDLDIISKVFVRVLNAMFHTRIEYPKDTNDNNNQPFKNSKGKQNKTETPD